MIIGERGDCEIPLRGSPTAPAALLEILEIMQDFDNPLRGSPTAPAALLGVLEIMQDFDNPLRGSLWLRPHYLRFWESRRILITHAGVALAPAALQFIFHVAEGVD